MKLIQPSPLPMFLFLEESLNTYFFHFQYLSPLYQCLSPNPSRSLNRRTSEKPVYNSLFGDSSLSFTEINRAVAVLIKYLIIVGILLGYVFNIIRSGRPTLHNSLL